MKLTEFRKLIHEEVRKVLKEAYRDPDENLDVLITLLKKRKIKQAIELIEDVKEKLKYDELETAFDEAVENAIDDGLGRAFGGSKFRPEE
jgi:hypothetical protein